MNIMKRKLFHLVALVAYATFAFYLLLFGRSLSMGSRASSQGQNLVADRFTLALCYLSANIFPISSRVKLRIPVRRGSNAMNSLGLLIPSPPLNDELYHHNFRRHHSVRREIPNRTRALSNPH